MSTSLDKQMPGKGSDYDPRNVEKISTTDIEEESFAFLWTLKNYRTVALYNMYHDSPIFRGGGPYPHYSWKLSWKPGRNVIDQNEYAQIYLHLTGYGLKWLWHLISQEQVQVRLQFSILNGDGQPGHQKSFSQAFSRLNDSSVWGSSKFILSSDLMLPEKRLILADGSVKIHCRIWIGELKHKLSKGLSVKVTKPSPSEEEEKVKMSNEPTTTNKPLGKKHRAPVSSCTIF